MSTNQYKEILEYFLTGEKKEEGKKGKKKDSDDEDADDDKEKGKGKKKKEKDVGLIKYVHYH